MEDESIKIIRDRIDYLNKLDSKGFVVLSNGGMLKLEKGFGIAQEKFIEYKKIVNSNNEEKMKKYFEENHGGVFVGRNVLINMSDIVAMFKEE